METKSNQNRTRSEILNEELDRVNFNLQWHRECYFSNEFQFKWRDRELKVHIKVFKEGYPAWGYRTHYTFTYDSVLSFYNLLDSQSRGSWNAKRIVGEIPEIYTNKHKLIIKAGHTSISINEFPLCEREPGVFPELNQIALIDEDNGGVRNTIMAQFDNMDFMLDGKMKDYKDGRNQTFYIKVDKEHVESIYYLFMIETMDRRDLLEYLKRQYYQCNCFMKIAKLFKENNIPYFFYSSNDSSEEYCPHVRW